MVEYALARRSHRRGVHRIRRPARQRREGQVQHHRQQHRRRPVDGPTAGEQQMRSQPEKRLSGDDGATMVEYCLMVALIALVCFAAVQFVGGIDEQRLHPLQRLADRSQLASRVARPARALRGCRASFAPATLPAPATARRSRGRHASSQRVPVDGGSPLGSRSSASTLISETVRPGWRCPWDREAVARPTSQPMEVWNYAGVRRVRRVATIQCGSM